MQWGRVEILPVGAIRVDVGIFGVVPAGGVVGDVEALAIEVFEIADAMFVMA